MKTLQTDVLVCGAGCAGLAAALAAARNNARTLVVERAGFAGGIITAVGLPFFDGMADYRTGRFVLRGIPHELLVKMGVCAPDATSIDDVNPELVERYHVSLRIPNTERFKFLADDLLLAHGEMIRVLFHTSVCEVSERWGRIRSVVVANKDGLVRIEAKQVIDCTGDADAAAFAGVPVEKTRPLMPMTLHFRIGNVRLTPETRAAARQALVQAHADGRLPMFYGPGLIFAFAEDEAYVHAIRVSGDASDAAQLSRAEAQGRRDAWTMFQAWKDGVPGFEDSYFISSGPYIGVRETRRIRGVHVLSKEDIVGGRTFPDAVATGCWYLDVHPNEATVGTANQGEKIQPAPYDIPYGSILARDVSNLLVAGRCHSATAEAASSTRVTATSMAMGQAAGTAAALACRAKEDAAELDGVKVREMLEAQNAGPYAG